VGTPSPPSPESLENPVAGWTGPPDDVIEEFLWLLENPSSASLRLAALQDPKPLGKPPPIPSKHRRDPTPLRILRTPLQGTGDAVEGGENTQSNQMRATFSSIGADGKRFDCMHVRSSHENVSRFATGVAIKAGSEVSWTNNFSALHLAAKSGFEDDVARLVEYAHDSSKLKKDKEKLKMLNSKDSNGLKPIDYALHGMLTVPSDEQSKPTIDLEMLDLLCPADGSGDSSTWSEKALKRYRKDLEVQVQTLKYRLLNRLEMK